MKKLIKVAMVIVFLSVNMAFGDCMSVLDDIQKERRERQYSKLPITGDAQTMANYFLELEDIIRVHGILTTLCGIASGDDYSALIEKMKEGNSAEIRSIFNYLIYSFDKQRN